MDLAQLLALHSPLGEQALHQAMTLAPDEKTILQARKRLEKQFPREIAQAALETALLRRRARSKFRLADCMFFTREALEQASSEVVARYRARRFAGRRLVADLCCGIGGDALALADQTTLLAVDRDPLRLAMARYNLAAHELRECAEFIEADVLQVDLSGVEAAFVDPDRRIEGKRVLSPFASQPDLAELRARFSRSFPFAAKLAPGVPLHELLHEPGEIEFLSLNGELKECVFWQGDLATTRFRATLLPDQHQLSAELPTPLPAPRPPQGWLYDPDPAILRAGLVGDLAHRLEAAPLDKGIAYLSRRDRLDTPFARLFRIEAVIPFHLQRLREYLREHRVGRVQILRRGSAVEPVELERRLKLRGEEMRTLVLTQVEGNPYALVVHADRP